MQNKLNKVKPQPMTAATAHIRLVNALSALVAANNCNYDREAMRSEGLFERAELLLRELGEWPQ